MMIDNFERLEEGLSRLLTSYEGLKSENRDLKQSLDAKDQVIAELQEKVKKLDSERAKVKDKVDSLLGKLDSLIQIA
ncbi:MAG: cell division protein ZapB [Deltaproteobacteria bacterium]|nr:cell division protein ZapB [Deltaproteobacteria bacterium]